VLGVSVEIELKLDWPGLKIVLKYFLKLIFFKFCTESDGGITTVLKVVNHMVLNTV